ncbi:hypothetical protein JHK85_023335 [Glycine max]|nr:hypothetical protein JHK85_023335 [Glycine max]
MWQLCGSVRTCRGTDTLINHAVDLSKLRFATIAEVGKRNTVMEFEKQIIPVNISIVYPNSMHGFGCVRLIDTNISRVLNEFTHGKQEKVSKSEFKEVLSHILLNSHMGSRKKCAREKVSKSEFKDLLKFVNDSGYAEMVSIFSHIESPDRSLHDHIIEALGKLTVEQGIPPTSDSWVLSNIVEPALLSQDGSDLDKPVTQETFLEEFKIVAMSVANRVNVN